MKISVWEQFSSNHSTGFTAVGVFETVEKAQHAESELRRLMLSLVEYYADEEQRQVFEESEGPTIPMSPVERAFAAEYGLDEKTWIQAWENAGIDWIITSSDIDKALHVMDNYVIVSDTEGLQTWLGDEPFATLLERMGGKTFVEAEEVMVVRVNLMCIAPDDETASSLYTQLDAYFKSLPPFDPMGDIDSTVVQINGVWTDVSQIPVPQTPVPGFPVMDAGSIERNGVSLKLTGIHFEMLDWEDLRQLIETLKERGCAEIEVTFIQEAYY